MCAPDQDHKIETEKQAQLALRLFFQEYHPQRPDPHIGREKKDTEARSSPDGAESAAKALVHLNLVSPVNPPAQAMEQEAPSVSNPQKKSSSYLDLLLQKMWPPPWVQKLGNGLSPDEDEAEL